MTKRMQAELVITAPVETLPAQWRRNSAWLSSRLDRGKVERFAETPKVSPNLAELLLKLNTHNRPIVQSAISEYSDLMMQGKWRLTIEAIGVDKKGVLVNGQHRLKAIIDSGVAVPLTIWFGIEPDEFEVIDQGRKRTAAHHVGLLGHDRGKLRSSIAGMLMLLENGGSLPPVQLVAERVDAMSGPAFDLSLDIANSMRKVTNSTAAGLAVWHLLKAGTSAADVSKFFENMPTGKLLVGPRLKLREELTTKTLSVGNGQWFTIRRAAAIILTWNVYRAGKKRLDLAWPHSTMLPEVVR